MGETNDYRHDPCQPSSSQPKVSVSRFLRLKRSAKTGKAADRRQQEHSFPWAQLPKELQVKVLSNLQRRDLCRCRALSKQVCEMIGNNEKSMKKRLLDFVKIERVNIYLFNSEIYELTKIGQGRVQLSMRCDEEEKKMKWVACQKRRRKDPLKLAMQIKASNHNSPYQDFILQTVNTLSGNF
ncbi:unnamed protein product [Strongylus vulgaris]|uniref:F-box domain-containing protein n=1 Tax=Strongylus vulgaris TaxID=40348 RepID=A0A3P7JBG5_STRVU|nr:unnamed protein product [Strongylus vulgaris]